MDVLATVGKFRREKLSGRMLQKDMWVVGNCQKKVRGRSRSMDALASVGNFQLKNG